MRGRIIRESWNADCQVDLDKAALENDGVTSLSIPPTTDAEFCARLLAIANQLGTPTVSRAGASVCEILTPIESAYARPCSLSKIYSTGEFPLHTDTAHWTTPCRFILLACASDGGGKRSTLLLDTRKVALKEEQLSLLRTTPFRVKNGRNSFFSTILSNLRPFVRIDKGCMIAVKNADHTVLDIYSTNHWPSVAETISWEAGDIVILDNWRVLHGRGPAGRLESNRRLIRILIQ